MLNNKHQPAAENTNSLQCTSVKMSDDNCCNGFGGNLSKFVHDFCNDVTAFCCVHNDNSIFSFKKMLV